jgi:hypothetical protein
LPIRLARVAQVTVEAPIPGIYNLLATFFMEVCVPGLRPAPTLRTINFVESNPLGFSPLG